MELDKLEVGILKDKSPLLPVLPLSLRSRFSSLSGGVRSLVAGYFRTCFAVVWPYHIHVTPERAPAAFFFLLPGVLSRLELNISELSILSAVLFYSEGGKYGVLTVDVLKLAGNFKFYHYSAILIRNGYLTRSHLDPARPLPSKQRFPQKRYLFITPKGVEILHQLENLYRSGFYKVVNTSVFDPLPGPVVDQQKNPGQ